LKYVFVVEIEMYCIRIVSLLLRKTWLSFLVSFIDKQQKIILLKGVETTVLSELSPLRLLVFKPVEFFHL